MCLLSHQVDDVSTSLTEQLAETQRDIDAEKSTLKNYLAERLSSDDQILSRLPGLVAQIVTQPEASEDEKSIEQWCKAIIAFRTAEIKARVDTVYLNTLSSHSADDASIVSDQELTERKAALQAEMEELHGEIASVAEMVVEHDIRKPMNEMKERKDRENKQARSAWLNYVSIMASCSARRLTKSGSVNTPVHGQSPRHNHYQHEGHRRAPAGARACQRSCSQAHDRYTCSSANTYTEEDDI